MALKEIILNIPGNKQKPKGYIQDKAKLIAVSSKTYNWVLLYTKQKQEI